MSAAARARSRVSVGTAVDGVAQGVGERYAPGTMLICRSSSARCLPGCGIDQPPDDVDRFGKAGTAGNADRYWSKCPRPQLDRRNAITVPGRWTYWKVCTRRRTPAGASVRDAFTRSARKRPRHRAPARPRPAGHAPDGRRERPRCGYDPPDRPAKAPGGQRIITLGTVPALNPPLIPGATKRTVDGGTPRARAARRGGRECSGRT